MNSEGPGRHSGFGQEWFCQELPDPAQVEQPIPPQPRAQPIGKCEWRSQIDVGTVAFGDQCYAISGTESKKLTSFSLSATLSQRHSTTRRAPSATQLIGIGTVW